MESRALKIFFLIVGMLALNLATFTVFAPFLVSYPDTLVVLFGFVLIVLTLAIDVFVCVKLYKKYFKDQFYI